MAKVAGKSTRYYLDEYALSGSLSAVDMNVTQETPNVTCFNDNGPRAVIGNYGHNHTLRGFLEGSSSQIDAVASSMLGSSDDHYLAELFGGTAEGAVCYESMVQMNSEPVKVAVGGAVALEMGLSGAGGMARSLILGNATLASTTGLQTSIDRGAATTNGTYQAVLRALVGSAGFTNVVLQVQDSSNNSTWGDSTGLTATFTAPGVSRVTSTAILRQYIRVLPTTINLGGSVDILVTGGIVAGSLTPAT